MYLNITLKMTVDQASAKIACSRLVVVLLNWNENMDVVNLLIFILHSQFFAT